MDHQQLNVLPLGSWGLGLERPLLIAGPCSAESREQALGTAAGIVAHVPGVRVFRAGVWKPRTRPGTFAGAGEKALDWLREVRERYGLLTLTEVATPEHVQAALRAGIDMLWIGARTVPNPFSVQAIADALVGHDVPVFVKNPINPDLQLWIGALERLHGAGLRRLAAVHRGFSWSGATPYRNHPMWEFPIRLKAAFPDLDLVSDPSHVAGAPDRLKEVAQQALDLNFSGLMVETHHDPGQALSDAEQQIAPGALSDLLEGLVFRSAAPSGALRNTLSDLRDQIDRLDADIAQKLGARMEIAERIGLYKREHNVAILQPERWERIMAAQRALGEELGLDRAFVEAFMNTVHQESIRHQTAVWEAVSGSPARGTERLENVSRTPLSSGSSARNFHSDQT
ncbi:MAG: bifunctional 3-deoxy-7-phosphoheptulonate synthase/chorismate mutase type II [Flavobacteriales bacterium]|nr:bifunctional 3-deoxy-7-phosphoheptulonate synthase/chorismate mutase type II [Flavobacteriales bacterium]MCB9193231.1 bifunctional 3-deoxy-7-phosphoheptulonate synthase/chorismate mutase type II [Flavobacteriales bacterium]